MTAKWTMYKRGDGHIGLVYSQPGIVAESLGILRSDTSDELITRWALDTERVKPGDVMTFASGRQLVFFGHRGEIA